MSSVSKSVALGFHNHAPIVGQFDDEIRVVKGNTAVPVNIIKLEVERKVVFGVCQYLLAIFQKTDNPGSKWLSSIMR